MVQFKWAEDLVKTECVRYEGHTYYVTAFSHRDSYVLKLYEDDKPAAGENTANSSFMNCVGQGSENLSSQILNWASKYIKQNQHTCNKCNEKKLTIELSQSERRQRVFKGLQMVCKKCRDEIYDHISEQMRQKEEKRDLKYKTYLDELSPVVIGGFNERIQAYTYLRNLKTPNTISLWGGFIRAKAILKANDATFYPVYCVIDRSSSGELWDSEFLVSGLDELIPQNLALPYLQKTADKIFPYTYETLATIEGDFHQQSFFGTITQESVRHHYSNLIEVTWPKQFQDIEETESVKVRPYLSIQHLFSTTLSTRGAQNEEMVLKRRFTEDRFIRYRSHCITAIMSSVSFLEASINELFMDSYDNRTGLVRDLPESHMQALSQMWKLGIPRTAAYPILDKYQIALTLCGKEQLNRGVSPTQDIHALVRLRNSLVHYEPEWVITQGQEIEKKQQKIESMLSGRFELNPFTGQNNPFFPDKCLSTGSAVWCLKSVIDFNDLFFVTMGIIPIYEKVRHKIDTIVGKGKHM